MILLRSNFPMQAQAHALPMQLHMHTGILTVTKMLLWSKSIQEQVFHHRSREWTMLE